MNNRRVVWVSALGYFVDMYDLFIFGIVRISSLKDLGISAEQTVSVGAFLLNWQMAGMLLGGILFGMYGDKRGRIPMLLGSILLYSFANIANVFVDTIPMYALFRFLAGMGLAAEIGAAVTLVSEVLPQNTRGIGATIVATVGMAGAIAASIVGHYLTWRMAYLVGGMAGLALLLIRLRMEEPLLYRKTVESGVNRGSLKLLFLNGKRCGKFFQCILVGLPLWYVAGILITFAPELSVALGVKDPILASTVFTCNFAGAMLGDILAGLCSQILRSRKIILGIFLADSALLSLAYLFLGIQSAWAFYLLSFLLGITGGYLTVFLLLGTEQFGTNLRATVATMIPCFVRGSILLTVPLFLYLKAHTTLLTALFIPFLLCYSLAFLGLSVLPETFSRNLDFTE